MTSHCESNIEFEIIFFFPHNYEWGKQFVLFLATFSSHLCVCVCVCVCGFSFVATSIHSFVFLFTHLQISVCI